MGRPAARIALVLSVMLVCLADVPMTAIDGVPLPPMQGRGFQWFFGGSADIDFTDDLGRIVEMESSSDPVTYEVFHDGALTRSKRVAAIATTVVSGQPLSWLDRLGAEFYVESGDTCGRGAPRFTIRLDVNLDGQPDTAVVGHLGSTDPEGACEDGWNTLDNLITDETPRFELPDQAWYLNTWSGVLTHLGQARIHSVWFDVDGAPIHATQRVKVISLTVNHHRFSATKAIKYFAEVTER